MSSNQWELKNRDEVCLLKTNYCTETVYYSLLLRMERREMDCILKNLVVAPIIKAKLKMNHGLLFLPKKKDSCISPKFQGNVFGSSKGYKGFLYSFARKTVKVP